MHYLKLVSLVALAAAQGISGAAAQEAPAAAASGTVAYEPDFFARFAPRNAYDMVQRVPGFTIDEGSNRRGLSGAAGNVRIDGAQPSAKSQSLQDILSRIPASDVARIELVRGESSGAAGAGQTSYVNVVRAGASGETNWMLGAEMDRNKRVSPRGELSWSGAIGASTLTLGATHSEERVTETGPRIRYDNSGAVITRRDEIAPEPEKESSISGEWSAPAFGGELTLTAQAERSRSVAPVTGVTRNGAGVIIELTESAGKEDEDTYEGGLSYSREFGVWEFELNGVLTRGTTEAAEKETELSPTRVFLGSEAQTERTETGESILRGVLSRDIGAANLQFGVEGAVNTLDQQLTLVEDDGTGPVPVVLPSANVRVEEQRAEAFATLSWAPWTDWKAEVTAAAETSTLTQEGDVNLETELTYWKPSFQLVRSFGENQLRARLYRDIGQLNFGDFVAASELINNTVSAGNPDLKPETSWRLEAAGDWRFGDDGAFALKAFRWWVDDARDVIPVGPPGARFAAPGNIGQAKVYGLTASFTLPLSGFLPGAQISGETTWQKSEATDPLTGAQRSLSQFRELSAELSFRQDLPERAFAWGASYEEEFETTPAFRLNEIRRTDDSVQWEVFAESTAIEPLKVRGWLRRIGGPPRYTYRDFFRPDRLGTPNGSEFGERFAGLGVGLTVSGSF